MNDKNTGGPAFPTKGNEMARKQAESVGHQYNDPSGMTLRDYFAAKAMQSMVSADSWTVEGYRKEISRRAYVMADAMLEARK